jgi:pantothenate kinase
MMFKNSVRTAKKTPPLTVTKINRLTLFKEIIAVYCENHIKQTHTEELPIVKAGGTFYGSYHWLFKRLRLKIIRLTVLQSKTQGCKVTCEIFVLMQNIPKNHETHVRGQTRL